MEYRDKKARRKASVCTNSCRLIKKKRESKRVRQVCLCECVSMKENESKL